MYIKTATIYIQKTRYQQINRHIFKDYHTKQKNLI